MATKRKTQTKRKTNAPYILFKDTTELLDCPKKVVEHVKVYPGAFPTVSSIKSKDTRIFLRFDKVQIKSITTETGFGRTQHKAQIYLSEKQAELVKSVENGVLEQIRESVIKRKLISQTVIDEYYKSNLTLVDTNYVIKANITFDKSGFIINDKVLKWDENEKDLLPDELTKKTSDLITEYTCLQPNVFYVLENMTLGLSWDLKSLKAAIDDSETIEQTEINEDYNTLINRIPEINF